MGLNSRHQRRRQLSAYVLGSVVGLLSVGLLLLPALDSLEPLRLRGARSPGMGRR